MTTFPGLRRGLRSRPTRRTVRWLPRKMLRNSCMLSSSIRRCYTRRKAARCSIISCGMCAAAPGTGEWIPLWRIPSRDPRKGGRRQGAAGPVRRRGFFCGCGTFVQGYRQAADLCLRGSRPSQEKMKAMR